MPTLYLAIDARRMKQGADEASAATRTVGAEASAATQRVDGLEKALDEAGVASTEMATRAREAQTGIVGLKRPTEEAAEATKRFGSDGSAALSGFGASATNASGTIRGAFAAIAGSAALIKLKGLIDDVDQLGKFAAKIGESVGDTQALVVAAERSNVAFREVAGGVKSFSTAVAAARGGGKEAAAAFAELGLGQDDLRGKYGSTIDLLDEVARRYRTLPDPVEKAAVAQTLFGRSSFALQTLLDDQATSIAKVRDELTRDGGIVSERQTSAAARFNDGVAELTRSLKGLAVDGVTPLLDPLAELVRLASIPVKGIGLLVDATLDPYQTIRNTEAAKTSRARLDAGSDAALGAVGAAARESEAARRKANAEAAKAESEANDKARDSVYDLITAYQRQIGQLGLAAEERERAAELLKVEDAARDKATGALRVEAGVYAYAKRLAAEYSDALRAEADQKAATAAETKRLDEARRREGDALQRWARANVQATFDKHALLDEIRRETDLLGVSSEERERAALMARGEAIATKLSADAAKDFREELARLAAALFQKRAATDAAAESDRAAKQAAEELRDAQAQQRAEAERSIDSVGFDTSLIGKSTFDQQRARARRALDESTNRLGEDEREDLAVRLDAALIAQNNAQARDHLQQIREENALVGLTAEERRRIVELRGFEATYGDEALAQYRDQLEALQESRAEMERMERLSFGIGDEVARGFEDALYSARSLGDVLLSVSRLGVGEFLTTPLRDGIGSGLFGLFGGGAAANANGNAYFGGRLVPYASGGVFAGPTYLPLADGNTGLFGEAGPEAAMPLKRMRDGKLGIHVDGGGRSVAVYQTVIFEGGGSHDVYGGTHRSTRQALDGARAAVGSY